MFKNHSVSVTFGLIIAAIMAIWLGSGAFIYYRYPVTERGVIGDMFGAVNALFSGLAFAGLLYTLHLQREENERHNKESADQNIELLEQKKRSNETLAEFVEQTKLFRQQTEELVAQTKYMADQAATSRTQSFEGTFFYLLQSIENTREAVKAAPYGAVIAFGRKAFDHLRGEVDTIVFGKGSDPFPNPHLKSIDDFFKVQAHNLNQYFESIAFALRFLHDYAVIDKAPYARMLWNKLSPSELYLLSYYGLTTKASELKALLLEFGLMDTTATTFPPVVRDGYEKVEGANDDLA